MTEIVIYQLNDEQRLDAKNAARRVVVATYGTEPTLENFQRLLPQLPDRADYENRTIAEYPAWLVQLIGGLMIVVFIAAAMPSMFRLFSVGRDYYMEGIAVGWQGAVVGFSTFLLAEFLIVLSTVAMRVLFKSLLARSMFIIPILLGLSMAFVGNWTITQPHDAMGWLETIAPPMAVLFTAIIGEQITLHSIRKRYMNERTFQQDYRDVEAERRQQQQAEKEAYRSALGQWQEITNNPEQSELWLSAYANQLKAQIVQANDAGRGRTERMEYLNNLERPQWIALIRREIDSEQWFSERHLQSNHQPEHDLSVHVNPTSASRLLSESIEVQVYSNGNGTH
jgi:hypothetical protein